MSKRAPCEWCVGHRLCQSRRRRAARCVKVEVEVEGKAKRATHTRRYGLVVSLFIIFEPSPGCPTSTLRIGLIPSLSREQANPDAPP